MAWVTKSHRIWSMHSWNEKCLAKSLHKKKLWERMRHWWQANIHKDFTATVPVKFPSLISSLPHLDICTFLSSFSISLSDHVSSAAAVVLAVPCHHLPEHYYCVICCCLSSSDDLQAKKVSNRQVYRLQERPLPVLVSAPRVQIQMWRLCVESPWTNMAFAQSHKLLY